MGEREMTFTVYTAGVEQSDYVTARLRELCHRHDVRESVEVIDITTDPAIAERDNIVGTPTVVRQAPPPRRRVIGILDDDRRVAEALGLIDIAGGEKSA
jgi:circadian clock protein KaiB